MPNDLILVANEDEARYNEAIFYWTPLMSSLYFSYPPAYANSELVQEWVGLLRASGYKVFQPMNEGASGDGVRAMAALAASCDALAVLTFNDGSWPPSAAVKAEECFKAKKTVFECSLYGVGVLDELLTVPYDRVLSVDAAEIKNREVQSPGPISRRSSTLGPGR